MTHADREGALLTKLARVRAKVEDVREELSEAGLDRTAEHVRTAIAVLDAAKKALMAAIRADGEAAGRKQ